MYFMPCIKRLLEIGMEEDSSMKGSCTCRLITFKHIGTNQTNRKKQEVMNVMGGEGGEGMVRGKGSQCNYGMM